MPRPLVRPQSSSALRLTASTSGFKSNPSTVALRKKGATRRWPQEWGPDEGREGIPFPTANHSRPNLSQICGRTAAAPRRALTEALFFATRPGLSRQHSLLAVGAPALCALLTGGFLERIPVMFEHSRHGERNFCILAG
jgi:hypothetical protein